MTPGVNIDRASLIEALRVLLDAAALDETETVGNVHNPVLLWDYNDGTFRWAPEGIHLSEDPVGTPEMVLGVFEGTTEEDLDAGLPGASNEWILVHLIERGGLA